MRIMGIDYGDVRTGIAISDSSCFLASPHGYIRQMNMNKLVLEIKDLVDEHSVSGIVLGYPKNMNATIGVRAEKTKEFADVLTEITGITPILWDERCTTMSASQYLNITNTRGKKRKDSIDTLSAVIILQEYLDNKNRGMKS